MYFSPMVKQELARVMPLDRVEQESELSAFVRMTGIVKQTNPVLLLILENPVLIKVIYFLFKKVFQLEVVVDIIQKKKKRLYLITIPDIKRTEKVLDYFDLQVSLQGRVIDKKLMTKNKKDPAVNFASGPFLRGAFLAKGFVNDPERMYHLEIPGRDKDEADMIYAVLQDASLSAKLGLWQKKWTVYMKKSEEIFEFLRFIGVQRALLNLQDIIARKDLLNTVNRLVNCETANLDKTILSANKQLNDIDLIRKNIGLENLPPSLIEVIKIRLENPYSSIQELANILGGSVSKSGIYHRLKKIEQLAEDHMPVENQSMPWQI